MIFFLLVLCLKRIYTTVCVKLTPNVLGIVLTENLIHLICVYCVRGAKALGVPYCPLRPMMYLLLSMHLHGYDDYLAYPAFVWIQSTKINARCMQDSIWG